MDRIDVLGPDYEIPAAMNRSLLSEIDDHELTTIVKQAAEELSAPIALVNLVLEHIQFFKTHYGLPSELAAARGTDRDVSFCQFVVKSGEPFEVTDAEQDGRVPKYLVKRYGIRAYLGMPLAVGDTVAGSLCVIDTKPRSFSDNDREMLRELAVVANRRLNELSERRKHLHSGLLSQTMLSGLAELRNCLLPIQDAIDSADRAALEAGPSLRLALHAYTTGCPETEDIIHALKSAERALASCQDATAEVAISIGDASDGLAAMEHAVTNTASTSLSTIAVSGRELARQSVDPVGGVILPDIDESILVSTPRSLAITLVATCLNMIAAHMANRNLSGGLRMGARGLGSQAEVRIESDEATGSDYSDIVEVLAKHVGGEPTLKIQATDGAVALLFSTVQSD